MSSESERFSVLNFTKWASLWVMSDLKIILISLGMKHEGIDAWNFKYSGTNF